MSTARKIELAPDEVRIQEGLKDGTVKLEILSMKALGTPDRRWQSRAIHLDRDHCHRLDLIYQQQGFFSPVVIFRAYAGAGDPRYILADGFHRHDVLRVAKEPSIRAYVFDVPFDRIEHEARLFSAMSNQVTMLSRTRDDIRKAVEMLFADPECWNWSNQRIGSHCGTTGPTVWRYRLEYSRDKGIPVPDLLETSSGSKIPSIQTRRTHIPRVKKFIEKDTRGELKEKYYVDNRGKTVYFGEDKKSAEEFVSELIGAEASRISLEPKSVDDWFLRRGIAFRNACQNSGFVFQGMSGYIGHGVTMVPCDLSDPTKLPWAVGCLFLLREKGSRMVVVCYPSDGHHSALRHARSRGIEFLTPEELVASLTD